MKLSVGKHTLPGRKQVFRETFDGRAVRDVVARFDESMPGRPLLTAVMTSGRRLPCACPTLMAVRAHAQEALGELPDEVRALTPAEQPFEVVISPRLTDDEQRLRARLMAVLGSGAGGPTGWVAPPSAGRGSTD
jgi:nicotinate phosphoribosyltransferase